MSSPKFRTEFDPQHGKPVELVPGLSRIVCGNEGPFTFHGTNTYLLGDDRLAIIDPGPIDRDHLDAIKAAIGGRPVSHIIVTHTHMDHSPLAHPLAEWGPAVHQSMGAARAAVLPASPRRAPS